MFSGRASLGPTGRRTYSTRETPEPLRDREPVLKKVGQKEGMRKNKGKEKSIVAPPPKFDSIITPALDV